MATHSSILAWRNPMDRGAWRATVHGVAKSRARLVTGNTTASPYSSNDWPALVQQVTHRHGRPQELLRTLQ